MNLIQNKLKKYEYDHDKVRISNQMATIINNKLLCLSEYVTEKELDIILDTIATSIVKYIETRSNNNIYAGLQICKLLHNMKRKYMIHKPFEPDIESDQ